MRLSLPDHQPRKMVAQSLQNQPALKRPNKIAHHSIDQRLPSINPETQSNSSKLYESLIDINKNYLAQKVKVSDIKKPQTYEHKLPSKTGTSQYSRRYAIAKRSVVLDGSVPQRSKNGNLMKLPSTLVTNFKTQYQAQYSLEKQSSLPVVLIENKVEKVQALHRDERPFFKETAYQRDYTFRGNVQTSPTKKLGNIAVGGRFNGQTTYKNNYKCKTEFKTQLTKPFLPRQHKIFVKINSPEKSNYQQSYLENQSIPEASFKPSRRYPPQFKVLGLKSEYKNAFQEKQLAKKGDFDYLDEEKLRNYISSISKS